MSDPRPRALVIGAGLGGLAAAMRLGAKGYRVEIYDRLDMPGGRGSSITQGGHRFDLGPTIVTVPNLFRDLWKACGRDFDQEVDLRPLDPFYEIRWPDGTRFAVTDDQEQMRAQIEAISPEDLKRYEPFLKACEKRYWFGYEDLGRRSLHKLWDLIKVLPTFAWLRADLSVYAEASRYFKDERLRMAYSFHPLFIGGDPFKVTSMYTLVSHLEKAFGVHYAMGGVAAIAKAMANVVRDQGGALTFGVDVDEILVEHGRAVGLRLEDGREIKGDLVVSGADAGHTYKHLMRNATVKRWTDARLKRTKWSMGLFVWYFGTKGTADKWKDVGHHTILNGPRYKGLVQDIFLKGKLAEDMSLYIHRPSVTDPTAAPAGDDTFYVLSPVPHLGHDNGVDWQTERSIYRQKVLAVLEDQLLPGVTEHLGEELIFTPEEFMRRYRSPMGTGFSIEPRILQSAWFRPHNISEEVEGLYLTGAGTHPGAGLPGVVASAEVMAGLIPDAPSVVELPIAAQ